MIIVRVMMDKLWVNLVLCLCKVDVNVFLKKAYLLVQEFFYLCLKYVELRKNI